MIRQFLCAAAIVALLVWPAFAADDATEKKESAEAKKEQGRELLDGVTWTYSNDGGKTFPLKSRKIVKGQAPATVARATFTVDDLSKVAGLWVVPGRETNGAQMTLNGKALPAPLKGMYYAFWPVDPKGILVKGSNTVILKESFKHRTSAAAQAAPATRLLAYSPTTVGVRTGPAMGAIGEDYFTVTCRTNVPATVVVTAEPTEPSGENVTVTSPRGYRHRFRVPLPKGTRTFTYRLTSQCGGATKTEGPFTVRNPHYAKTLRIVAAGDCRNNPDGWNKVSEAMRKTHPHLTLFSGDMVGHGKWDHAWDVEFFHPARSLLADVPFYGVLGNHEHNAPLYFEMFYSPGKDGRDRHWSQRIGSLQIIGVDGAVDWTELRDYLEPVLKDSDAKFIFFVTHYPAWSSSTHGMRREGEMTASRKVVMPRLAAANATVMIGGHDHCYERSEPPADVGVTCIVSGGAGAPLYGKRHNRNSYSRAFFAKQHYCVFDITGDTCELKVYDLEGNVVDKKTFKAREIPTEKKKTAA